MRTTLFAAALLIAVPASIGPALAAEPFNATVSIDVPYSDLNLANPAGATAMLARIRQAAAKACGGSPLARSPKETRDYRSCVNTAVANAVRQLNAPLVTALYLDATNAEERVAFAQERSN